MTHTVQLLQDPRVAASPSPGAMVAWAGRVRDKACRLGDRVAAALNAWADARADAALYEALFKLSDAELRHRGLSRGDLHRAVSGS